MNFSSGNNGAFLFASLTGQMIAVPVLISSLGAVTAIHAFQDRLLPPLASDDDRPAGCGTVIMRPAEEDEDEADDDYVGKEEEEAARQEWLGGWVEGKEV
jgi:hypothetical protein